MQAERLADLLSRSLPSFHAEKRVVLPDKWHGLRRLRCVSVQRVQIRLAS